MTTAVVVGGGIAGCAAALALGDLGYSVTVVELDPGGPPADPASAWRAWTRPHVPQSGHAHAFTTLGVRTLAEHAPQVLDALHAAGAERLALDHIAPRRAGEVAWEDAEFPVLACRRPVFEAVLHQEAAGRPGVSFRLGEAVEGIRLAGDGTAHRRVSGVRLRGGEVLPADLVVDAGGRGASSGRWAAAEGAEPGPAPDETARSRISGYVRFYRLHGAHRPTPLNRGNATGAVRDGYAAFLHPADNGTFSVSYGVLPDDRSLRALRGEAAFQAAAEADPLFEKWAVPSAAEPISTVRVMAFADNVLRGAAVTPGQHHVHGLFRVGDAACVTNPLYGRGVSLALAHAFRLAGVLRRYPEAGDEQSAQAATAADTLFRPWYDHAVRTDAERLAWWNETVHGLPSPAREPGGPTTSEIGAAAARDPEVFAHVARTQMTLPPDSAAPGPRELADRVARACADTAPAPPPGPAREQLHKILQAAR
ncbi:hypothetical protein N566_02735 [Streptomycetaceae bacterium MP113-05]|nr:hypothetical protein N566_02735 [Streptomycetaceae bacterium MP113-05]